jgi:uncharacterized protein YkwD
MAYLLKRIFFIIFLCGTIIACEKEEVIDLTPQNNDSTVYDPFEIEVMNLVNIYRNNLGLPSLSSLKLVSYEAKTHTVYMIGQGVASHDNFLTRTYNLIEKQNALSVSENVSYGKQTANEVLQSWLLSSSHKAIIESKDLTHFGISALQDSYGKYYITQIYIKCD